jgi:hypothetical protein
MISTKIDKEQVDIDMKIKDCQLDIIRIMSEIQDFDSILNEKEQYFKTINIKIEKIESKLAKMGIVKQCDYLFSHLTKEQIDNVKTVIKSELI